MNALVAKPQLADAAVMWGPVSSDYYDNFHAWDKARILPEDQLHLSNIFGPLGDRDSFRALSAYHYLDRIQTPFEIHQGTIDTNTPIAWSEATAEKLDELGKDFTYRIYPGVPHIFVKKHWARAMANAVNHFDKYLK